MRFLREDRMSDTAITTAFRGRLTAIALVAAPVAFAAAELLTPDAAQNDAAKSLSTNAHHRGTLLAAAFVGLASAMLLIPAVAGVLGRIRGRGAALAQLGTALIGYGLLTAHGALDGVNIMFYEMTGPKVDRAAMVTLLDRLQHEHAVAAPLLLGHYAFALGVLLFGIGVWRAGVFARWVGPCLVAWVVSDVVLSGIADEAVAGVVSNAFAVAAMWTIAWELLRRPSGSSRPGGRTPVAAGTSSPAGPAGGSLLTP
jgi:hypothetical protein